MKVQFSTLKDFDGWLALAREVEPLFGPMSDQVAFQDALRQAISEQTAFCIRSENLEKDKLLDGGIVVSKELNEIVWLAVSDRCRGKGLGRALLKFAINELNRQESVVVQTFDESVSEGVAARALYTKFGFIDIKEGGLNPAGIPTVIMHLPRR